MVVFFQCKKKERLKPEISSITESVYASGVIKTKNQYQVYAEVSGLLQKILVSEGDTVEKSQPVFIIENRTSELRTKNSQLELEMSRERLKKIKDLERKVEISRKSFIHDSLMMERYKNLLQENATTQLNWEQSRLTFQNSKTTYLAALNELDQEKTNLQLDNQRAKNDLKINQQVENNYIIQSKIEGRVYDIYPKEGESVNPQTSLGVIGDLDQFIIEIQIDELDIIKVKKGQNIFLTMGGPNSG